MEVRRTNKHGLGLALTQEERSLDTILTFCAFVLSRACTRTKSPHSYQERWLIFLRSPTRPLGPQVPAPRSAGAFLWLSPFPDCPKSLSSVDWSGTLPFLVFFQSRRKSRAQALCVGFAPKQTKESSDWRSPTTTETNAPLIVLQLGQSWKKKLEKNSMNWKLEEELKPFRPKHYKNRLGYLEESWRPEEIWRYQDFKE